MTDMFSSDGALALRGHARGRVGHKSILSEHRVRSGRVADGNDAEAVVIVEKWGKSLADAEATLKPFSRDAFDRLHCDRPDVRTQFVQFGGIAVHGFREPYVTYNRSRSYSDLFRAHLAPLHWDFVDAWLPTASRPEGAQDGMHYRPPTCSALMDVFFHLLCRDGATEQRGCAASSS